MSSAHRPSNESALQEVLDTLDTAEVHSLISGLYGLTPKNKAFIDSWNRRRKPGNSSGKPVELVNIYDLVSMPQVAPEYGYNPDHLRRLAVKKKIKGAHFIGGSWLTTRRALEEYRSAKVPFGRPRGGAGKA